MLDGVVAGALAEHVDVEQRVGAEAVGAVHRHAGALAGGVQARDDGVVVRQHLGLHVGRDPAHRVVRGRHDRHRLDDGVDAEVGARELGDVRQLRLQHLGPEVRAVEQHVVLQRPGTAALGHLLHHAAGHDVAGRQVLDRRRVPLHEPLTGGVAQDRALAAGALGQQDAELRESGRVELEELHVLQRQALAPHDADAVAREGVGVRGGLVDLAEAAGGEDDRLRLEDVQLARRQLVRHDAGGALHEAPVVVADLRHRQVERVVLVVELDARLDAVLVQRLQDHVARAA